MDSIYSQVTILMSFPLQLSDVAEKALSLEFNLLLTIRFNYNFRWSAYRASTFI